MSEELGLEIKTISEVAVTSGDVPNQQTHWWKCRLVTGEIRIQQEEIGDAGYFTRREMEGMNIWPATQDFFLTYNDTDLTAE